jgi:hypothetical protein
VVPMLSVSVTYAIVLGLLSKQRARSRNKTGWHSNPSERNSRSEFLVLAIASIAIRPFLDPGFLKICSCEKLSH